MTRKLAVTLVAFALASGCDSMEPETAGPMDFAWKGTVVNGTFHAAVADTAAEDTVTIGVYVGLDEDGRRFDGVLTIMSDTTLAYDPYEVLVDGLMTRDSTGDPAAMLAEFTRYDGARCRIHGLVDSLGWWESEVGCGGARVDSVTMHPFGHGFVSGTVERDGDAVLGARVWYCKLNEEEDEFSDCKGATYSGAGGAFRLEAPPGRWFVTFSIWDPIWDRWDYCRSELNRDSTLGRKVTVRKARVTDASRDCPWFF